MAQPQVARRTQSFRLDVICGLTGSDASGRERRDRNASAKRLAVQTHAAGKGWLDGRL